MPLWHGFYALRAMRRENADGESRQRQRLNGYNQLQLWMTRYSQHAPSSWKAAYLECFFCLYRKESLMKLPGRTYPIGANVRITRGSLAGVTGVVIETSDRRRNCVLSVDFWAHGIRLALNGDDLEQIEQNRPRL